MYVFDNPLASMIIGGRALLVGCVWSALACSPDDGREVVRLPGSEGSVEGQPASPSGGAQDPARSPSGDSSARDAQHAATLVFLGTSLTAGYGLDSPHEAYPARIREKIDSAGLPFEVVNAGVSGATSAGGLRQLDWILQDPVDVLVVELGANDGLRGQDTDALRTNLREIIDRTRVRNARAEVLIAGMEAPPNLGPAYTAEFREVFAEVALEEGAYLIPFMLDGVAGVAELNQTDGIHPTAEGHALMAEAVWRILAPVLEAIATNLGPEGGS